MGKRYRDAAVKSRRHYIDGTKICQCDLELARTTPTQMSEPPGDPTRSILRHARIDLVGPRQDSAFQILDPGETGLPEEVDRLPAAHTAAAVRDDVVGGRELVHPGRQLAQRDQVGSRDAADLPF